MHIKGKHKRKTVPIAHKGNSVELSETGSSEYQAVLTPRAESHEAVLLILLNGCN